jgi:hypothetical protein
VKGDGLRVTDAATVVADGPRGDIAVMPKPSDHWVVVAKVSF